LNPNRDKNISFNLCIQTSPRAHIIRSLTSWLQIIQCYVANHLNTSHRFQMQDMEGVANLNKIFYILFKCKLQIKINQRICRKSLLSPYKN
jgi:hypothetical protein